MDSKIAYVLPLLLFTQVVCFLHANKATLKRDQY